MADAATITINVKHGKISYDVSLPSDAKVSDLRTELHKRTEVAPALQKLMFKSNLKPEDDTKTLAAVGIVNGSKMMMVGTKIQDVMSVTQAAEKAQLVPSAVEQAKEEEKALFDPTDKEHKKILDEGIPSDAMPGLLDRQDPIPPMGIKGCIDKGGIKIRLSLKSENDEMQLQSTSATRKIPFATISDIKDFPVPGHPEYSVLVLLMGKTSRYYLYWVPSQFVRAIKRTVLGFF